MVVLPPSGHVAVPGAFCVVTAGAGLLALGGQRPGLRAEPPTAAGWLGARATPPQGGSARAGALACDNLVAVEVRFSFL